jgi:hypothetical protein
MALIVRKTAGDIAVSCPELGIAAHKPIHRKIAVKHAALQAEDFKGVILSGADRPPDIL